jgi:hypothetical protein
MAVMVVIATTHRDHLVSETYYEQELKYQGQIDSAARTKSSGASVTLDAAGTSLVVTLPPSQLGQKISGSIELYRPSAPDLDRQFPLAPSADGTQKLDVSKFAAGLWVVRVKWNAAGQDYFLEQKITVAGK